MEKSEKEGAGEPDKRPSKPSVWVRLGRFFFDRQTGAILTRTPLSWLKILVLTLTYWALIAASCLVCWAIFQKIVDADVPYWRTHKGFVTNIFTQPDLNIRVSSACPLCLEVSINKMLLWTPAIITKKETLETIAQELKSTSATLVPGEELVYVTCKGKAKVSAGNKLFQGMKYGANNITGSALPGYRKSVFPWSRDKGNVEGMSIILNLTSTPLATTKERTRISITCQAWADNIDRTPRFIYKETPPGGALAFFTAEKGAFTPT